MGGVYGEDLIPDFIFMKFRFGAWTVSAFLLAFALFPVKSFASTKEDNNRLVFYGVGIGFGAIMCDFVENKVIDISIARIAISNIRSEMKTDSTYTELPLGPVRVQSVKDGFNASVKEMSGCSLRFD